MSRNEPLAVPDDDDDDDLPDHLTNVLLRENSRQGVVLRAPNPIGLAAGTPIPTRQIAAIAPSITGAAGTATRVIAPTMPVAEMVSRSQQQVVVAPIPPVAPLPPQQPVQPHRPHPHQRTQAQPLLQQYHHNQQQQQWQQHQPQQAGDQRHQPQAFPLQAPQLRAQQVQKKIQHPHVPQQVVHRNQPQQNQASDPAASRPRPKHDSPAQVAIWNCVYYNVQTYQLSILKDVHHIIARAQAEIDPRADFGGSAIILERLQRAVQRMNIKLIEKRTTDKITYDTVVMSSLIQMQNTIIKEELQKLGMNLASLAPFLNLDIELKRRSDAAYLAVKERVDRAKRAAATKTTLPVNGLVGSLTAKEEGVYHVVHTYQQSILKDVHHMIAQAQSKVDPHANGGGSPVIQERLKNAMKRMNLEMDDHRSKDKKITFDVGIISSLINSQNLLIKEELRGLGINLASLAPLFNLDLELKKRADTSYQTVKERVDRAKRGITTTHGKTTPPASNEVAGARVVKEAAKPATTLAPSTSSGAAAIHTLPQQRPVIAPVRSIPVVPLAPRAETPLAPAPAYTVAPAVAPLPTADGLVMTPLRGVKTPATSHAFAAEAQSAPTAPLSYGVSPAAPPPAPELPSDSLKEAKRKFESAPDVDTVDAEERRLRNAPALAAAKEETSKPWFVTNVVNHRHAWCSLRDAAEKAGMRQVLQERPWANPEDHSNGVKQAVASDVLKLMSLAAQHYLKDLMEALKVIAWQRNGGLSAELLAGVESRLENPSDDVDSPQAELRRGLLPKLSPLSDMPRVLLKEEEESHRRECQIREERWEAELTDKLTAAEELRKRLIRRGQRKLPTGGYKWWEEMETTVKSGWLSREQQAEAEFARRMAIKHGIGVVASVLKRKEDQANKDQSNRGAAGGAGTNPGANINTSVNADPDPRESTRFSDISAEDLAAARSSAGKQPIDPLEDKNPIDTVRNIRRRLTLGRGSSTSIPEEVEGGGVGGDGENAEAPEERPKARKFEIDNADLAELLRSTKPKGGRKSWGRILYRAQNGRTNVHAAGTRAVALR